MPPLTEEVLVQKAVLWTNSGRNGPDGRPKVNAGVEIDVRWEKIRKQVLLPDGTTATTDALVSVDREIADGSVMWKGELDNWLGTGSGDHDGQLYEVVSYDEVPDDKGLEIAREVGLIRRHDVLPEIV